MIRFATCPLRPSPRYVTALPTRRLPRSSMAIRSETSARWAEFSAKRCLPDWFSKVQRLRQFPSKARPHRRHQPPRYSTTSYPSQIHSCSTTLFKIQYDNASATRQFRYGKVRRFLLAALILGIAATSCLRADSICPATGVATGCGVLITITDTGSGPVLGVTMPGNGNPYDGSDDTLVGVINDTAGDTITSFILSFSSDIFGFDGDGMCTYYGVGTHGANTCGTNDFHATD